MRVALLSVFLLVPAVAVAATESLDAIEARLDAAEAVRAAKRLQHAYGHYLEAGRWADVAALFTANASVEFPDGRAQGTAGIRELFMKRAGRNAPGLASGQLNVHLQLQPIVDVRPDGGTVLGTWHEFWMTGQYGKSAASGGGVYENEYRRENGVWRISRMRYFMQYEGDYDTFGHKAPPSWNIPYHYEAKHVGASVPGNLAVVPQKSCAIQSGADVRRVECASVEAERRAQAAARIVRMQDETDVQNLQHAFGYYLDRKLYEDAAELFAANGEMKFGAAAAARGGTAIKASLAKLFGPAPLQRGELFDHLLMGTVVSIDADGRHARARSTQLGQLGRMGEYANWELGVFENRFVKEGGKWKLQAVHFAPTMLTDFDLGWARDWRPRAGTLPMTVHFALPRDDSPPRGWVVRRSGAAPAATRSAPDLAQLDLALRRVIAVDAVENLNSNYGYTIDESDWDGMADAYSVTVGAKELTGVGVYVGRERIRKALKLRGPNGGRSPTTYTIHQLTQPVTTVSADGMSARQRLRLFQDGGAANGSSGSWIGGIYEETAVYEEGEWKLATQDLHHLFNASYRNGWARVGGVTKLKSQGDRAAPAPAAAPRAAAAAPPAAPAGRDVPGGGLTQGIGGMRSFDPKEFPPDRQIRARQYAFPDIVEVGFHYVNPVSGRAPAVLVNP